MSFPLRSPVMLLIIVSNVALTALLVPATAWCQGTSTNTLQFTIPAGELDKVLNQFAVRAGIRVHLNADLSQGIQSPGLNGHYSIEQGFARLLSNTGLRAEKQPNGTYRVSLATEVEQGVMRIPTVSVVSSVDDHEAGYDAVYDEDISTAYSGKEVIERYKGKDSADIFKGMLNIYSGDARNGGGLDPSIRGIQGPGRVPLAVDGTEQALTVWRGYRGISNRNYIDPNLIGSVKVIKGPAITPNVHTSVGGGIVVNTLSASDVLKTGDNFGGELKVESSDNAISPRTPTLLTGMDYRDVPGFPQDTPNFAYGDPSLWKVMSNDKNTDPLSGDDYAYRLALASRGKKHELLGAYAYRKKGNYFSGNKRADYYSQPDGREFSITRINPRTLAHRQRPGYEVPNTSSELESLLLKGKLNFADAHALELGLRYTQSEYGEIMSSRAGSLFDNTMAQWPLSNVDAKAYNLKYTWQPKSKLINLESSLWATDTVSDTNSAGGFPNFANHIDSPLPGASPILRNTAAANSRENRVGFDISNKMKLTDRLDLSVAGSYRYHKLRSDDQYNGIVDGWRQWPRAGRREEYTGSFTVDWRSTDYLILSAGLRYSSYWVFDDFLDSRLKAGDERFATDHTANKGVYLNYESLERYSEEEIQQNIADTEERIRNDAFYALIIPGYVPLTEADKQQLREKAKAKTYTESRKTPWLHNSRGIYSRANNPCANGTLTQTSNLIVGSCRIGNQYESYSVPLTAEKHKDDGWVPALSITVMLSNYSRVYLRYTEALRYPSLFESTLGFSSSFNPYTDLKPEQAKNYELAYVYNFKKADIKFSYFEHITDDVIERSGLSALQFYNIERQTIRGLEFSGRYDSGRFFTDISLAHNLENEVCDESQAIQQDPNGTVANCQRAGFTGGYLIDQAIPESSANWNIGARFFNKALETGVRIIYLSDNHPDEELQRDSATTVDAYINYRANKNLRFELVGTNLTDLYYIDPLVRSSVPAPGRTIKLGMSVKF